MAKKKPRPKRTPADWPTRLKTLRLKLGGGHAPVTQAEAARLIRVGLRTWLGWENGETEPSPPLAMLIELLESGKI